MAEAIGGFAEAIGNVAGGAAGGLVGGFGRGVYDAVTQDTGPVTHAAQVAKEAIQNEPGTVVPIMEGIGATYKEAKSLVHNFNPVEAFSVLKNAPDWSTGFYDASGILFSPYQTKEEYDVARAGKLASAGLGLKEVDRAETKLEHNVNVDKEKLKQEKLLTQFGQFAVGNPRLYGEYFVGKGAIPGTKQAMRQQAGIPQDDIGGVYFGGVSSPGGYAQSIYSSPAEPVKKKKKSKKHKKDDFDDDDDIPPFTRVRSNVSTLEAREMRKLNLEERKHKHSLDKPVKESKAEIKLKKLQEEMDAIHERKAAKKKSKQEEEEAQKEKAERAAKEAEEEEQEDRDIIAGLSSNATSIKYKKNPERVLSAINRKITRLKTADDVRVSKGKSGQHAVEIQQLVKRREQWRKKVDKSKA